MTAKEKLREVVNDLSELEAEQTLAFIASRRDPIIEFFANAPIDDEPTTPDEDRSVAEAFKQRDESIGLDELERELG